MRELVVFAGLAAGLLALSGCGAPNRHRISTGDLTAPPTSDATIELAPRIDVGATGGQSPTAPSAPVVDAATARGGVGSIRVTPGVPDETLFVVTDGGEEAGAPAPAVVDQVMIDSVVGQINGRPVFASEFFEPMDARLSALAREKSQKEWMTEAHEIIQGRLFEMVRNELLLAEYESSLTVEQRSGLLFWVSQLRENLVSQSRGSEELLSQKLLEEEGVTIDEKIESVRRFELIREQLRKTIGEKAYVPWRDVVLQYKQDEAVYKPAPTAHLRMIQVAGDDLPALDRVETSLADGESFEAVARRESLYGPRRGGAYEIELTGETYGESRIFGPDELNEAALALEEGEVSAPVTSANGRVSWIYLESIESSEVSLYDAQFAIYDALQLQRREEEQVKYFQKLISRSSLSPVNEMEARLLEIASMRYLIEEAP